MNFYKETLKLIKDRQKHFVDEKTDNELDIFRCLVQLLGERDWNSILENQMNYHKNFGEFFYNFHKSMRQTDFYDMEGVTSLGIPKNDEELKEWQFLADNINGSLTSRGIEKFKQYYLNKSIGGYLDSIFHSFIHTTNIVEEILEKIYNAYKENKENISINIWDK